MKTLRYPLVAALALGAMTAAPAGAVDETKPSPACWGLAFTDKKGDHASKAPQPGDGARDNLDMLGGFYKYDAAQGADAATFNIQISNLSKEIPQGATAISWYVSSGTNTGDTWLRALTDFTGVVSYEYGHYELLPNGTNQSLRDGETQGAFFEGADGVIQIVMPADADGKPGTLHKAKSVTAYEARQVLPGASPTPAKGGLLYEVDVAATKQMWTVGEACPATAPAVPLPSVETTAPAPVVNAGVAPLPVKVSGTKLRAKKIRRKLTLKVSSTEALTRVGAQLKGTGKKAKRVYAKGSMAKLSGKGKLKLKVTKKLTRGRYQLDLVGTDAAGARRFTAAKLTVR